jgi:glycosyltransferase involved in cell wall biosynthesis
MSRVHVVVPDGIDDPARPSGGNRYDRRLCDSLAALGWDVREHAVPGAWPAADATALGALQRVLAGVPDDAVVLIDGLIASAAGPVLVPAALRLRLAVLMHMPLGTPQERAVLAAARSVITTSPWTAHHLRHQVAAECLHVAEPGADPAALAPPSRAGNRLLCVAAVTALKGLDVLVAALARVTERPWTCVCVGTLEREPAFAAALRAEVTAAGLGEQVRFVGPRTGAALDAAYHDADLVVLASRSETFGMVVTEALARGIPVLASDVGGVPHALGRAPGGTRPGLLVPPDDPPALAAALRHWLGAPDLRERLRHAARERRDSLPGWDVTAARVAAALPGVGRPIAADRGSPR